MTPFKIPESAFKAIQHLVNFSEPDFEIFLDALTNAEPSLDKDLFWTHVAEHAKKIDKKVVESILHEIFEMHEAWEPTVDGLDKFVDLMAMAAAEVKSENFKLNQDDQKKFKGRLKKIFEGRKGLETTVKAMDVLLEQEHTFYHARIVTDIRPIFNKSGDSVDATVIVHNLRIHYGKGSDHKDFYVALDTSDIHILRQVLDRAVSKANCLQGLVKQAGISYLDAEE
jgi:hypothetical protein